MAAGLAHLVWSALGLVVGCTTDCMPQNDAPILRDCGQGAPQIVDRCLAAYPGPSPSALLLRTPLLLLTTRKHRVELTKFLNALCAAHTTREERELLLCCCEHTTREERELLLWGLPLLVAASPPPLATDLPARLMGSLVRVVSVRLSGNCVVVVVCHNEVPP
eukprot:gene40673-45855_t